MKNRIGAIVLIVICVGLSIALIVIKNQASQEKAKDTDSIQRYSNQVASTTEKLDEQKKVSEMMEKDLATQRNAFVELTNNYATVAADLAKTQADLKERDDDLAKRNAKITELEAKNQMLDQQAMDLSASLTNLNIQISETQRKLAASEGDKAFLQSELKRLLAEKQELERQFNDLTVLRAQVAKVKQELTIARRLEWIREGLFASTEEKGAQKLMQGATVAAAGQPKPKPSYDLNVEVGADGSVKVIPPLTNAPATNPPAAK